MLRSWTFLAALVRRYERGIGVDQIELQKQGVQLSTRHACTLPPAAAAPPPRPGRASAPCASTPSCLLVPVSTGPPGSLQRSVSPCLGEPGVEAGAMLRIRAALVLLVVCASARAAAVLAQDPAATAGGRHSRRRLLIASCVGTGGTGCLDLQPSSPAPLPTDQLTLVAAELAELTYPGEWGGRSKQQAYCAIQHPPVPKGSVGCRGNMPALLRCTACGSTQFPRSMRH